MPEPKTFPDGHGAMPAGQSDFAAIARRVRRRPKLRLADIKGRELAHAVPDRNSRRGSMNHVACRTENADNDLQVTVQRSRIVDSRFHRDSSPFSRAHTRGNTEPFRR